MIEEISRKLCQVTILIMTGVILTVFDKFAIIKSVTSMKFKKKHIFRKLSFFRCFGYECLCINSEEYKMTDTAKFLARVESQNFPPRRARPKIAFNDLSESASVSGSCVKISAVSPVKRFTPWNCDKPAPENPPQSVFSHFRRLSMNFSSMNAVNMFSREKIDSVEQVGTVADKFLSKWYMKTVGRRTTSIVIEEEIAKWREMNKIGERYCQGDGMYSAGGVNSPNAIRKLDQIRNYDEQIPTIEPEPASANENSHKNCSKTAMSTSDLSELEKYKLDMPQGRDPCPCHCPCVRPVHPKSE